MRRLRILALIGFVAVSVGLSVRYWIQALPSWEPFRGVLPQIPSRAPRVVRSISAPAEELALAGVVVRGSMGQQRPHPPLKLERELRREIVRGSGACSSAVTSSGTWTPRRDIPA